MVRFWLAVIMLTMIVAAARRHGATDGGPADPQSIGASAQQTRSLAAVLDAP